MEANITDINDSWDLIMEEVVSRNRSQHYVEHCNDLLHNTGIR